jgi:hypothetical protein
MNCRERCLHLGPPQDMNRDIWKTRQSARRLGPVSTYGSSSALRVFAWHSQQSFKEQRRQPTSTTSRPAIAINSRPVTSRAPPQASHYASGVFTVRVNKSAYHLQDFFEIFSLDVSTYMSIIRCSNSVGWKLLCLFVLIFVRTCACVGVSLSDGLPVYYCD